MRITEWLTAVGLAAMLTSPLLAQAQAGTIRVRVRVPGTLAPVPGVQISLSGPGEQTSELPDNEEDLLAFLEELAAARGIIAGELEITVDHGATTNRSLVCPSPANSAPKTTSPSAVTDAEGIATIPNLQPGTYRLSAGRDGYVGAPLQKKTVVAPQSVSLEVAVDSGILASQVSLFLTPAASVSGRVVDANGSPVVNACVQLGQVRQEVSGTVFISGPRTTTDSKGQYRLQSVGPGDYVIRAQPAQSGAATIYFPGVREPEKATTFPVEAGSNTASIDFKLP